MKKIMIVNTSTDVFEGTEIPTGLWLSELVHFIINLEVMTTKSIYSTLQVATHLSIQ